MVERYLSAAEFEKLTPAEQDEAFDNAVDLELGSVDPAFLDRVRRRILAKDAAETA